jgi:hypothetical protein
MAFLDCVGRATNPLKVPIDGPIIVARLDGLTGSFEESLSLLVSIWFWHSVKSLSTRVMDHIYGTLRPDFVNE